MVLIGIRAQHEHRINYVFETYHPDIVYHAAAHKHVPLMEDSPNEAIKNNVFGTWKTAMAAAQNHTKKFVHDFDGQGGEPDEYHGCEQANL